MTGYSTGIQNGIYSINDVRALEDMDLLSEEEGGFIHVLNGNVVRLADAGAAYKKENSGEKEETKEPEPEKSDGRSDKKRRSL